MVLLSEALTRPSTLPNLNILLQIKSNLVKFQNSLIYWKIMKIFKYWACHLYTQHIFKAACYSLKPDMQWAISQNPNNRLMALMAAGGEYIEDN